MYVIRRRFCRLELPPNRPAQPGVRPEGSTHLDPLSIDNIRNVGPTPRVGVYRA
jgi:hypothetical protein